MPQTDSCLGDSPGWSPTFEIRKKVKDKKKKTVYEISSSLYSLVLYDTSKLSCCDFFSIRLSKCSRKQPASHILHHLLCTKLEREREGGRGCFIIRKWSH